MTDTPYYSSNLLAQYQDSLKDYRDLKNSLDTYYGEGLQKGKEEGLQEGLQKGKEEGLQEGLQKGKEEGLQEGLQKGSLSEKKTIALNALKKGFDNAIVRELTGLSLEEIALIRREANL